MTMPSRTHALWALVLAALFAALPAAQAGAREAETIPGRYIVVYKDSVERPGAATTGRERALGFSARHRYAAALKGFAAKLNDRQLARLRADGAVDFVAPDRRVHASAETIPAGIRRIEAATTTTVGGPSGVGVAIIDTGIDDNHPDLPNLGEGKVCIGSSTDDDNGHGTHVAGTVAAANNGSGVVGVAPGTTLHPVKVLDRRGSGTTSTVVCGINWVKDNADRLGIRVANMSLGGLGDPVESCGQTDDPEHKAICNSTAAGVVYAVAAGNSGWDFDYEPVPDVPAAYPEVVTVTAMTDMDGAPGAVGGNCKREKDDQYASFSNFALGDGAAHTIAAPGVCVVSTQAGGGTVAYSGTSMATPHVAGALALCIDDGGTNGPCAALAANQPGAFITALADEDPGYGFLGDPNHAVGSPFFGYLTRVGIEPGDGGSGGGDGGGGEDPPPDTFALTATGYKVKGVHHVDLTWSGATTANVDVFRNDDKITTTANDGAHTDNTGNKGGATYTYRVCEAGTTTCSADVTVVF